MYMKRLTRVLVSIMVGATVAACGAAPENAPSMTEKNGDCEAVISNIMSRRSIRHYADRQVPADILESILECGINAPNGRNQQAYEVRVVSDSASTAYLAENVKGLYKAPVYVFIANDTTYDMSQIDAGLLSGNIGLSAWAYGIGSVNLGGPVRAMKEDGELIGRLNLSDGYELCLVLALGYPDEAPEARPRNKEKVRFVKVL